MFVVESALAASLAAGAPRLADHWWHGPGVWWPVFPIAWGLLWIALIVGGAYLWRRQEPGRTPRSSAEAVLAERYARGDITEEEYQQAMAVLRATRQ